MFPSRFCLIAVPEALRVCDTFLLLSTILIINYLLKDVSFYYRLTSEELIAIKVVLLQIFGYKFRLSGFWRFIINNKNSPTIILLSSKSCPIRNRGSNLNQVARQLTRPPSFLLARRACQRQIIQWYNCRNTMASVSGSVGSAGPGPKTEEGLI